MNNKKTKNNKSAKIIYFTNENKEIQESTLQELIISLGRTKSTISDERIFIGENENA